MSHTSSYIDNQHFLTILENCSYFPIFSKPMQILYNSIKNSLKMHGDYPIDSLVDCICSRSGISKEELLEDHTLFEKSLRQFFGEGEVDIITDLLKKGQISSKYATFTNNLIINNILWDICSKETFEFITKIPAHEHIVIIYKNENSIGKLASKILAIENAQSESSSSLTKMPHYY